MQFQRLVAGLPGFLVLPALVKHPRQRIVLVDIAPRLHLLPDHRESVIQTPSVVGISQRQIAIGRKSSSLIHALDHRQARRLLASLLRLARGFV